ncbi:MAG: AHH domain-containing protein [Capnocytophaga sp.]|nr:AHH domain-containing protein [Capnocytophaga sp.]
MRWWLSKNTFIKYDGSILNFEAHHIIPIDVLKANPDLKQLLFDLKKADPNFNFNFNGIENGMMLQKKSLRFDINGHASHKAYNFAIDKKITEICSSKELKDF